MGDFMLKVLRDNLKSLHWVLWAVVAVLVLFVFAQFGARGQLRGTGRNDSAATVGHQAVSIAEFKRAYEQTEAQYRQAFGNQFTPDTAKKLRLPIQVLERLITRTILLDEARQSGLEVGDAELRRAILHMSPFKDREGNWVGEERYRQILRANGYTVGEFQESLRDDLLVSKLQSTLQRGIYVSDQEVEDAYRQRVERAAIRFVRLPARKLMASVQVTPEQVKSYFESHKEAFRLPERRVVDYLLVDAAVVGQGLNITEPQIQKYYEAHKDDFTTPEQVHARHILLRTGDNRTPEEAEKELQKIRARIEAGEDFSKLASEVSEDPGSRAKGGDLGFFGRQEMVAPFAEAAFNAKPGDIVGPVQTPFGVHLIQVLEHRQGGTEPLSQVKDQIVAKLRSERSWDAAAKKARQLAGKLENGDSGATAMQQLAEDDAAVTYASTPAFGKDDYVPDIGRSNAFTQTAFELKQGAVSSEPVRLPTGWSVLRVRDIEPSRMPKLDEARDRVAVAARRAQALAEAKQQLTTARQAIESGESFADAAKKLGLEVQESGQFAAGDTAGTLGKAPDIVRQALTLDVDQLGGPVEIDHDAVLYQVSARTKFDPQAFAKAKESTRQTLAGQRLEKLLGARVTQRRKELGVQYNNQLLANFGLGPDAQGS
jgi:peptidyl-prolyl cis-trans isomerase D